MAFAWTALGILAAALFAILGIFLNFLLGLGARIDAVGARLDSKIDSLGSDLRNELRALAVRLDAHVERHAG